MHRARFKFMIGVLSSVRLQWVICVLTLCHAVHADSCAPNLHLPADGETVMPGWTVFLWSEVSGASDYDVGVFETPPSTNSPSCAEGNTGVAGGFMRLEAPPKYSGTTLYWAVRALYADGSSGPWSQASRFRYDPPRMLFPNECIPGLQGEQGSRRYYEYHIPQGRNRLSLTLSGSGGCDLFVKRNSLPSPDNYDGVLRHSSDPRSLLIDEPTAGTWYFLLYGSTSYDGVVLTVDLEPAGLPQMDIFADFRVPEIATNGIHIDPSPEIYYNPIDWGNPHHSTTDLYTYVLYEYDSGVKGTFWLDSKRTPDDMRLAVNHVSSSVWDSDKNEEVGYSPITIEINGHQVADQWDAASKNQGTHGLATDVFGIPAGLLKPGSNTIYLRLGSDARSTYWLQSFRIYPDTQGRVEFGSDAYSIDETASQVLVRVLRLDATPTPAGDPNVLRPDVTLHYTIQPISASPGVDYEDVSGTIVFKASELSKNIVIPICDDTQSEGLEQFTVSMSSIEGGAHIGSVSTTTVTIVDDEASTAKVYVSANAQSGGDGTCWGKAYCDLQQGLTAARALRKDYVEVWVAQGIYTPAKANSGDRTKSFDLANGVAIFGGFSEVETERDQRNPLRYPTILSGDIEGDDGSSFQNIEDNSLHVVTAFGVNATAILDGFTIRGGCTDEGYLGSSTRGAGMLLEYASPTVRRCVFTENKSSEGAGAFCGYGSNPVFVSCRFLGNWVEVDTFGGGGLSNWMSSPLLINCVFSGNRAPRGGAICNWDGSPILINCTVQHNFASRKGGGMYTFESLYETVPVFRNTVIAHNVAVEGPEFGLQGDSEIFVEYSCVEQMNDGVCRYSYQASAMRWGEGVIDVEPQTTPDGHLKADSPLIGAGAKSPESRIDMDGETRHGDVRPAIGADEYIDNDGDRMPDWWEHRYFGSTADADPSADTDEDGLSNQEEYEFFSSHPRKQPIRVDSSTDSIQAAIASAEPGDTIRLATGTYRGSGNTKVDLLGKPVVIVGPDAECVCDEYAFRFKSGETPATAIVGLTITRGDDPNGTLQCSSASPQLRGCTISNGDSRRYQTLHEGEGFDFLTGIVVQARQGQVYFQQGSFLANDRPVQWGIARSNDPWSLSEIEPDQYLASAEAVPNQFYAVLLTSDGSQLALLRPISVTSSNIVFEWDVVSEYAYPCSGLVGRLAQPVLADCDWSSCFPLALDLSYGSAVVQGDLQLGKQGWCAENALLSGSGILRMERGSAAYLRDCFVRCAIQGPGSILCPEGSDLVLEKSAELDLGNGDHSSERHVLRCDGLLYTRDFASVRNARIQVNWTNFTSHSIMVNNVFEPELSHRWGEFYVEGDVKVTGNDIYADGDRYLDLDPDKLGPNALITDCNICVTVSEGVGSDQGSLLELRGLDLFCAVGSQCPSGIIQTGLSGAKEHVPPFSLSSWTLDRLELLPGAQLNLTNRFDYGNGDPYEVLYVKDLVLGEGSILNTAFNTLYCDRISGRGYTIVDVPLLGYSLVNIAFEDADEFELRVQHNNSNDRSYVNRDPDYTCGPVMRMCTLPDDTGIYREALAKGQFAKASKGKITVRFEYLFESPTGTLEVYLSDVRDVVGRGTPDRDKHYRFVGQTQPGSPGRPGSADSGRFSVFEKVVDAGDLDFRRGTYIELELRAGVRPAQVLIDNWDPWEHASSTCGDVTGTMAMFEPIDFAFILSECGNSRAGGWSVSGLTLGDVLEGCAVPDGYITFHDALASQGLRSSGHIESCKSCVSVQQTMAGAAFLSSSPSQWPRSCFWLVGKANSNVADDPAHVSFLTEYVYFLDERGIDMGEPVQLPPGSSTAQIHVHGNSLYLADLGMGPIRYSDADTENILTNTSSHGPAGGGSGILDIAWAGDNVYVTPVFSDSDVRMLPFHYISTMNGDKYDYKEPMRLGDCTDDQDVPREVETDSEGNVYVLVPRYVPISGPAKGSPYDDRLFVFSKSQEPPRVCDLGSVGIHAPTAMHVSGGFLYLSSSLNSPEARQTGVYCLPISRLIAGSVTASDISSVSVSGMGHITAMATGSDGTLMVVGFTMEQIPTYAEMTQTDFSLEHAFYRPFFATLTVPLSQGSSATAKELPCKGLGLPLAIVWAGE